MSYEKGSSAEWQAKLLKISEIYLYWSYFCHFLIFDITSDKK